MRASKTVSIELDDIKEIENRLKTGEVDSFSEFVQKAIKNELER